MSDFATDLAGVREHVIRFVTRMSKDRTVAEDVAAEAIMKAWVAREKFQAGTSMKAWVCFIARNIFLSMCRRSRFDGGSVDDLLGSAIPSRPAHQDAAIDLSDALKALELLPRDQRDVVLLIGAGATYEEAAEELCVSVGTVKSRVARGRDALHEALA